MRRSRIHVRLPRMTLAAAPAGAATAVALGIVLAGALPATPTLAETRARGAAVLAETQRIQRSATALRPSPQHADRDRGRAFRDGCLVSEAALRSPRCVYGDPRSKTTVVLLGDSHALQYFPPLERIARARRWRLVMLAKAGCPAADVAVYSWVLRRGFPECATWRTYALARIQREERPAMIVASGYGGQTVMDGDRVLDGPTSRSALTAGYARTLAGLRGMGIRVVVIRDSPRPEAYIPDCVLEHLDDLRRCAFARDDVLGLPDPIAQGARAATGIEVIDPSSRFCPGRRCPAVIGDVLVYRNRGHITATYTATMTPWLARRIPALAGDRRPSRKGRGLDLRSGC